MATVNYSMEEFVSNLEIMPITNSVQSTIQEEYMSLEEAKRYIPTFDGYNIEPEIFIEKCQRVNRLIDPKYKSILKDIVHSKIFGEAKSILFFKNYNIHYILQRIRTFYIDRPKEFVIKSNRNEDKIKCRPDHKSKSKTENSSMKLKQERYKNRILNELKILMPFCMYCENCGHSAEMHCCNLLKTNKPLKISEQNLLSKQKFLNKLYKRELGLVYINRT